MKLLFRFIVVIICTVCTINISRAQSLDEIIERHLQAHGDLEKWDKINSMKITGRFTAFSIEDDFMAIKTKDGAYYSELSLGKNEVIEAFDGKNGWTIDTWLDIPFPRELNKAEQNVFLQKAEFFTPFYNYKSRGITAELIGKKPIDGVDTWEIKLTRPNGKYEKWFLDAETFLEFKSVSYWVDFATPVGAETYYDDFRDFDGLIIPCFIERTFWQRDRVLEIEDIEFNIPIDYKLFEIPKSEEMKKLDFLIGKWDVVVMAWSNRARRWYNADSTASEIKFAATNLIRESIRYDNYLVQNNINEFTYNSNENKYQVVSYNGFSSSMELFRGQFSDTSFILVNSTFGCDSLSTENQMIVYDNISDIGFDLTIKQSADNGTTWNEVLKMHYANRRQ